MKIIILGAGQVGGTLAENLSNEQNDITVVDIDSGRLRELQDRLDIRTIVGKGSYPSILEQAGAEDADMLVAVTNSDEINMVACQITYSLFKTPSKIARVRGTHYLTKRGLFNNNAFPIDVIISPEQLVTNHIRRLLEHPGALQVLDFANGKVQLVAVKAYFGGPLVGQALRYLTQRMPKIQMRVAAIFRSGSPIIPEGSTVIEADDEVFFIAAKHHIRAIMSELRQLERNYSRILIAGGGNIGERLAKATEKDFKVKIIEHDMTRCKQLSENLSRSIVLNGNASDKDLLLEEGITNTDVFLALTNDDEANIMSSMLAKRLGAYKVMALINNPAYVNLVQGGEIDIAISPQQATIGTLLTHVRRGDVVNVHALRRGAAEAMEAIAHGDQNTSRVVGRKIAEIDLPAGTTIGAIVRGDEVLMAHSNIVVESNDHVILFLIDKRRTQDLSLIHI